MKIGIIVGSMQAESNSAKVGHYIAQQCAQASHSSFILDLGAAPMPLWGSVAAAEQDQWESRHGQISAELGACDGLAVISPEYHGMVPAALKNFFMHFGSEVLGHKPAFLIGVSAGTGGAYPVAELRMSSYKNNRLCYTPEHCIVRSAGQVLNGEAALNEDDMRIRRRLDYGLAVLFEYAKALLAVRHSGVVDLKAFANGM